MTDMSARDRMKKTEDYSRDITPEEAEDIFASFIKHSRRRRPSRPDVRPGSRKSAEDDDFEKNFNKMFDE